mmetsp:Transcript_16441/g.35742  ORF Transcript_16441/g.35742 Transcript_16441/m.35742 type:complete len:213 (-) Transcript_16441:419-1057(-)
MMPSLRCVSIYAVAPQSYADERRCACNTRERRRITAQHHAHMLWRLVHAAAHTDGRRALISSLPAGGRIPCSPRLASMPTPRASFHAKARRTKGFVDVFVLVAAAAAAANNAFFPPGRVAYSSRRAVREGGVIAMYSMGAARFHQAPSRKGWSIAWEALMRPRRMALRLQTSLHARSHPAPPYESRMEKSHMFPAYSSLHFRRSQSHRCRLR